MPDIGELRYGSVVLVPFPFTNQQQSKRRPAVVISSAAYHSYRQDCILMPITSQLREGNSAEEAWIAHWQEAGLLKPSAVKPVIATMEQRLLIKRLGWMGPADQAALRVLLDAMIGSAA